MSFLLILKSEEGLKNVWSNRNELLQGDTQNHSRNFLWIERFLHTVFIDCHTRPWECIVLKTSINTKGISGNSLRILQDLALVYLELICMYFELVKRYESLRCSITRNYISFIENHGKWSNKSFISSQEVRHHLTALTGSLWSF